MEPNNNTNASTGDAGSAASKRQAMTGQWRTPPLPVFGSVVGATQPPPPQAVAPPQQQQPMPPQPAVATQQQNIQLPESTDDYAKALQEAYRRGAEAAAAMQQQQQQQHMPNAVSCPNFHQLPVGTAPTVSTPATAPVEPPQAAAAAVPQQQPVVQQQQAQAPPPQAPPVMMVPNPLAASSQPMDARSFSLPDMASYAARAQAEEEKRKKRLARNRASARLRRLRKKNLVDSYEGEVGVLELSLQKLKAHEWGKGHSHDALLEALGMERGQQALSLEERQALISQILEQQRTQLAYLREAQLEQQVLKEFVTSNEENGLWQELERVLNLSPEQKMSLATATAGLDEEVEAMETLETCLVALKDRLAQDGAIDSLTNQFMGIFHQNQVQKFLLWSDANAEAIDQLDYCHAGPPQASPIFSFGMDDYGGASQLHLNTNMEEEAA